ncbi:pirin family protein [Microvirga sp. W0021]|uniref:Pirin family protein n=1 Tax=Hohaiivirga grylli TaxID=3133970 RepID=A0ABV0BFE6_9HYPH
MMILRPANERGHANHGWLNSWHSFSFAGYYDENHMHWGPLRVINDDRVAAGRGFGTHPHKNMEIISYVLDGSLSHKDSLGNTSTIVPGEVQRMSAGSGVMHSEFNHEQNGETHFLQIWIIPDRVDLPPSYEQTAFTEAEKRGKLRLVASPNGQDGSVTIHQDAKLYAGLFDGSETASHSFASGRLGYLHVATGSVEVNGKKLQAGDALLFKDDPSLEIKNGQQAEVLLFDMADVQF